MEQNNKKIKKQTIFGFFWKFSERILARLVSLIVSIVLARLLTPDDYSVVGIVSIFFAFANIFISGGFNTALIQQKDSSDEDYSTTFCISFFSASVLYIALFLAAPFIASAYQKEILVIVLRVMGLTFFVNSFKSILCAYVAKHLQFKKFFFATIIGTIISAVVGITMALNGFGPWALVAQQMTNSIVDTLVLFVATRMRFRFRFSKKSGKSIFNYGWKIMASSIIATIYDEINPLIIGLKYTPTDLSYYTKGKSYPSVINSTFGDSLAGVLFPVMSKIQHDKSAILSCMKRFMQTSSFLVFPMMIGFSAVADKFISIVLTEKWMPALPYIQIFCIVYMLNIIQTGNLQVIRAIGRSDMILILEIIKKLSYAIVIILFLLLTNNPIYLAISCVVNSVLASIINTTPNKKLINYSLRSQIIDLLPNFINALIMGIAVYLLGLLKIDSTVLFFLQIAFGITVYILLNLITRNPSFYYLLNTIKRFFKK